MTRRSRRGQSRGRQGRYIPAITLFSELASSLRCFVAELMKASGGQDIGNCFAIDATILEGAAG
eukprot:CAMPEP_0204466260 /NCGR_PEP_ID=MMETSP0471-20130131/8963_1 /ASSEMBLY_ACC=CAM_ASM_000602 /TAXON_ID=2969 /ORGANISM="Oxyrrhis marina" /LENGTH=63 /DNA_ID=CAMNT_0051467859 /DNA_START=30 /DNA_END=225 /DNA_ORIENTATION=-